MRGVPAGAGGLSKTWPRLDSQAEAIPKPESASELDLA